jgi:hypothetical protein
MPGRSCAHARYHLHAVWSFSVSSILLYHTGEAATHTVTDRLHPISTLHPHPPPPHSSHPRCCCKSWGASSRAWQRTHPALLPLLHCQQQHIPTTCSNSSSHSCRCSWRSLGSKLHPACR